MQTLILIFGEGKDLTFWQMGCRGLVIFFIAFLLIRISGRRSFGIKTPLDNIIIITLGAVLSRAIVGASAFIPVVFTCLLIVSLHRFLAWLKVHNKKASKVMDGEKILLYMNGAFLQKNLDMALVCIEDVLQGVRECALTDDLSKIEIVYMERNGEISVIKKQP
jgi:uncharacterized membrane protein YcaP (DUF421 family)